MRAIASAGRAPLWQTALAAAQGHSQPLPDASSASAQTHSSLSSSAQWITQWSGFFHQLQHRQTDSCQELDLVPGAVLRSMGQHWVDCALHAGVMSRVAKVYPPARVTAAESYNSSNISSSSSNTSNDETNSAQLERLLTMWSAQMLLASVRESAKDQGFKSSTQKESLLLSSPDNALRAFAKSLQAEVLPTVSYLIKFAVVEGHDAASLLPLFVVQHALCMVLRSFWSEWTEAPSGRSLPFKIAPAELAFARALCSCINVLQQGFVALEGNHTAKCGLTSPTENKDIREGHSAARQRESLLKPTRQEVLDAFLELQLEIMQGGEGSPSCGEYLSNDTVLMTVCRECVAQTQKASRECFTAKDKALWSPALYDPSLFMGVTGVPAVAEESDEVIARINEALNQVALSSIK